MKNVFRKMAILLVTVSLILSGCATMDGKKTWRKIVVVATGAVACGAAGYLAGGNKGAVIGAITCAIAAYTIDELVAKRQEGYAKREEAIAVETQIVKRQTETLKAENRQLAQDIKNYKQKMAALKGRGFFWRVQLIVVKRHHEKAKQKLAKATQDLKDAKSQYDRQKTANTKNEADLKKWKTQVANLEKEKQILESNVDTLFSMTQAI